MVGILLIYTLPSATSYNLDLVTARGFTTHTSILIEITIECTFLVQFLTLKNLNKIELANCIAADIVNLPYN